MSSIPIPFGVKCELIYLCGTQRVENVYYVTRGAIPTGAQLIALWTLLRDWENVTAKVQRSSQTQLVLIALTTTDGPGGPVYEAPVSPVIPGSNASGQFSCILSVAVKHTTGLAGRSYRGRSYWIGIPTNALANQESVSTTFANAIAACYTTLRTSLAAAGWTFCVASQYSGVAIVDGRRRAIPRAAGFLTPITASSAEVGLDTQRHSKAPYQV